MTIDVSTDYLLWDNREDCTLRSQSSLDVYDDYLIESQDDELGGSLRRVISNKEVYQGEGRFTGKEIVWNIPRRNLGNAPAPKVGDIIVSIAQNTEDEEQEFSIVEVSLLTWQTRYRCITVLI